MSTNPMTRQEAEAAGWELEYRPLEVGGYYLAYKHESHYESPLMPTEEMALADVLVAITSIERYADAERLLEEAKDLLQHVTQGRTFMVEIKALLTKLEANHAGT